MPTKLERWPRGKRGSDTFFPWIPSSSQAAIKNLATGLSPAARDEVFKRLIRLPVGQHLRQRAEDLKSLIERAAQLCADLDHLGLAVSPDSPVGRLETTGRAFLKLGFHALYAAGREAHAEAQRFTSGRARPQGQDALVAALSDLPWMSGQVLATAAIAVEVEKPIGPARAHAGGREDEWEKRRKRWDKRLARARETARRRHVRDVA